MIQSNAWNWLEVQEKDIWTKPADEAYALTQRWKNAGKSQVLDLGCGIGRHSLLLAKNGFQVSAFDLSEDAIKILANTAEEESLIITTQSGDMLSLPYEDGSFDGIIAFHVIYHTTEEGLKQVLQEILRILKPAGEVFLTLLSRSDPSFSDTKHKKISDNVLVKLEGVEKDIPHIYMDEQMIFALLKDFTIIDFYHKEEIRESSRNCHYFLLLSKNEGI